MDYSDDVLLEAFPLYLSIQVNMLVGILRNIINPWKLKDVSDEINIKMM